MNALYSLYDALLSIDIPADKAKAVVTAMEQEMSNVLATKTDLQHTELMLRQELVATRDSLKQELTSTRDSLKQEIASVRDSVKQEIFSVRNSLKQEISALDQRISSVEVSLGQKMELMRSSMVIQLGSIVVVGMGVLFAALKLTGTG